MGADLGHSAKKRQKLLRRLVGLQPNSDELSATKTPMASFRSSCFGSVVDHKETTHDPLIKECKECFGAAEVTMLSDMWRFHLQTKTWPCGTESVSGGGRKEPIQLRNDGSCPQKIRVVREEKWIQSGECVHLNGFGHLKLPAS